jgi:hypothetical protein
LFVEEDGIVRLTQMRPTSSTTQLSTADRTSAMLELMTLSSTSEPVVAVVAVVEVVAVVASK